MTTTADTGRTALLKGLQAQWQATEVAVRRCEDAFDAPVTDQWTVGDLFRHLVGVAHRLAPDMLTGVFQAGALQPGDRDGVNAAEVAKFKALTARSLQIELSTAHATVWMFLQRYTEADLARPIAARESELSFGEFLQRICGGHERRHVEEAIAAAGARLKPAVPFRSWS